MSIAEPQQEQSSNSRRSRPHGRVESPDYFLAAVENGINREIADHEVSLALADSNGVV